MNASNILIPYEGKWIALTSDRKKVIASADTILDLEEELKNQKEKGIILTKVLPFDFIISP